MITIAMDVHVRNYYLHVTDDAGNVLRHGRCHNALMDLAEFLGPIEREAVQRSEPIRAVLESTTNSRAIQRRLTEYGRAAGLDLTAEVLDARKIRIIAESVCKCDRLDAKVLGELARSNLKLPTCYMPDDEEFALRDGGPSLTLRVAATGVTCLESGRESLQEQGGEDRVASWWTWTYSSSSGVPFFKSLKPTPGILPGRNPSFNF